MKRYNWEYNGEKMGLFERDNGICVLYSDHIAEVERLQLIVSGKTQYDVQQATAIRCAEITEQHTSTIFGNLGDDPISDCIRANNEGYTAAVSQIAEAIRKEFDIEKGSE